MTEPTVTAPETATPRVEMLPFPTSKPRLLDLFCCEGGAGEGYARAGFEVVGVDSKRQRRYPHTFLHADALEVLADTAFLSTFAAVHASPPCQAYSITKHSHGREHPMLIEPTRELLRAWGGPYVIENVVGAPLIDPVTLCGTMFDLRTPDTDGLPLFLRRHRLFESNVPLSAPRPCSCIATKKAGYRCAGAYGGGSQDRHHAQYVRRGGYTPAKEVRAALIGADWMTLHGLSQSIPPAYAQHIGAQLLAAIEARRAA